MNYLHCLVKCSSIFKHSTDSFCILYLLYLYFSYLFTHCCFSVISSNVNKVKEANNVGPHNGSILKMLVCVCLTILLVIPACFCGEMMLLVAFTCFAICLLFPYGTMCRPLRFYPYCSEHCWFTVHCLCPTFVWGLLLFSHSVLSNSLSPHAHQASLFFTISRSLLRLMSIESMMPSNHPILSHTLLLLPSVFPSIRLLFGARIRYIAGYLDCNCQNAKHWAFTLGYSTLMLKSCKDHWGFKNFSRYSSPFKAVA